MIDQTNFPFEKAGSVAYKEVLLINSTLKSIDVLDYMSEINIQEDIFSPVMHGRMLFIDSRNLIKEFKEEDPHIGQLVTSIIRLN